MTDYAFILEPSDNDHVTIYAQKNYKNFMAANVRREDAGKVMQYILDGFTPQQILLDIADCNSVPF